MASPLAVTTGTQPTWVPHEPTKDCSQGLCSMYCPQWCYFVFPPPPPFYVGGPSTDEDSGPIFSPLVIAIIGVLAVAFLLVSYYTFISRYCGTFGSFWFRGRVFGSYSAGRGRGRSAGGGGGGSGQSRNQESWNVSPASGLDETLIAKITLCKYKRGDAALIHTTDCSVCLGEFRDGESLRLLPKCSHAFHQQCIDKWLKSHSNCPLCRSNITLATMGTVTPEPEGCGTEQSGRDANTNEVVVVMDGLEIMCEQQQNPGSSFDGDDHEATTGGPERLGEADSKAEIREEGLPPKRGASSSSDPNLDCRVSIADVLQSNMEDELMAARESGLLTGGAGTSRRCHGENSREWGRSSLHALQDAMDSVPMKRLPPAGRSCFSSGRDSGLPM